MSALSPEVKQLLDRPNFAHFATLMPDGSPNATPVWVGHEGDRVVICTSDSSLKAKNTKRDRRVALSVVDFTNPYEEVQIRGHVVERRPEPDLKTLDGYSHRYTGKPFPFRNPDQIVLIIEVDKVRYAKLPFQHAPTK